MARKNNLSKEFKKFLLNVILSVITSVITATVAIELLGW